MSAALSSSTSLARPSTTETSEALEGSLSATNLPADLDLPEEVTDFHLPESSSGTPSESTTRGPSTASSPSADTQASAEAADFGPQLVHERRRLRETSQPAAAASPAKHPFRCPDPACPFSSRYLRDVSRHLASKKHGQDAAAPKFPCAVAECDVAPAGGFSRFDNFQRHMRSVHHVRVRAGGGGRRRTRTREAGKRGDEEADEAPWEVLVS